MNRLPKTDHFFKEGKFTETSGNTNGYDKIIDDVYHGLVLKSGKKA